MGSPDGHRESLPGFYMGRFPLQDIPQICRSDNVRLQNLRALCAAMAVQAPSLIELGCPSSQSSAQRPHAPCAGVASPSALDRTRSAAGRPGSAELNHMAQIYGLACPITKTLMMDPVVASDGYTVRTLAASCKTYMGAIWAVMDPESKPAMGLGYEQDMHMLLDSRDMVY